MRVRRLNRYVEETRPWDLAKDRRVRPARLDVVLYSLAEGLRVVTLLLHAYMPETGDRLLTALGEDRRELAAFGSRGGGQATREAAAAVPEDRDRRGARSPLAGVGALEP